MGNSDFKKSSFSVGVKLCSNEVPFLSQTGYMILNVLIFVIRNVGILIALLKPDFCSDIPVELCDPWASCFVSPIKFEPDS